MTAGAWLRTAIGEERLRLTSTEASRRRLMNALGTPAWAVDDQELQFVSNALELQLFDALEDEDRASELRAVASDTFQISRTLPWPDGEIAAAEWLLRLGCLAAIADRSPDFRRIVTECELPALPLD